MSMPSLLRRREMEKREAMSTLVASFAAPLMSMPSLLRRREIEKREVYKKRGLRSCE